MNRNKLIITFVATVFIAIVFKICLIFQEAPEKVVDIVKHWSIAWAKGGVITAIIILIVFGINKYNTEERRMSLLGLLTLPIIIPLLLKLFFGYHGTLIAIGICAGLIIGYFSYIIDDLLIDLWQARHITLPLLFGLSFGGSVITACLLENWQDENVYVVDHATCTEVSLQRYTYHKSGKTSYWSWDTYKTFYFFARGHNYPNPQEGVDYSKLGPLHRARFSHHNWIGAINFGEYDQEKKGFKWLYLTKNDLEYHEKTWYEAEEDFFGQVIKSGKQKQPHGMVPNYVTQPLPTSSDVPDVFTLFYQFFKIMFSHKDFSLLRWIYILVYLPLALLAIFIPLFRAPFWILLISSTIIILIIVAIIQSKTDGDLFSRDSGGFGGGYSGGGGAGHRW